MKNQKPLFDRKLVRTRRTRGRRMEGDGFLNTRVAEDAVERVRDINRKFERSLLIGPADICASIAKNTSDKLGHVARSAYTNTTNGLDLVVDEEALPFPDACFDFIFSGLGLHAVNAIPKTLMDINRLLKPDGLFICAFFGGETLSELRHALYEAEEIATGKVSPRVSPMIDVQQAAGLLQKSGFAMPVVDRDLVRVNYPSLQRLFEDLRQMGETNVLMDRTRSGASKQLFAALETIYRRDHLSENNKLRASFDILWITGWCPHESQQKPLKPGTAKTRLSDALGVPEHKL